MIAGLRKVVHFIAFYDTLPFRYIVEDVEPAVNDYRVHVFVGL